VQRRTEKGEVIGGETLNIPRRRPRVFASGRTCAEPDCATRLSVYNQERFCSVHTPRMWSSRIQEAS
jgi:hypothetical protein